MGTGKDGHLWPDGVSISFAPSVPRVIKGGLSGAYYWNPGSDTAPPVTLSGILGLGHNVWEWGPGLGLHLVFLRSGMTSADTLGYGTTSGVSTVMPSINVNSSIPDENYVPQFSKAKVSSIEAGVSNSIGASTAGTYTVTPRQIGDAVITPAMGPDDELSPFMRSLQSGVGKVGQPSESPVRFLSRRGQALGDGMSGWTGNLPDGNTGATAVGTNGLNETASGANVTPSRASPFTAGAPSVPFLPPATPSKFGGLPGLMAEIGAIDPSNPDQRPPGGLAGLFAEYMRNNAPAATSR